MGATNKFLRALEKYAQYCPTSLTMQNFIDFGSKSTQQDMDSLHATGTPSACEKTSMSFLKKEIPVRLANIMKELNHLPKPLLISPSVRLVTSWYQRSFEDMLGFENADTDSAEERKRFSQILDTISRRHLGVVETVAEGVLEYRDSHNYDLAIHNQIQYFLDRFYMSRISIRMLINQHTLLFCGDVPKNTTHVGCIDPYCDILAVAKDGYESARFLCEQYYMTAPDIEFECKNPYEKNDAITMVYIPSHLYHILFEVFKNAMRAVVEHSGADSEKFPKIKVLVCKGKEDVMIKISDNGGGIPRSQHNMLFNYMYSTAPRPSMQSGSTSAPLAGYGYGLPLSRLYARYFHGDLSVSTIDGYGSDVIVTLKTTSSQANELLPIYNATTSRVYSNSVPLADWSKSADNTDRPPMTPGRSTSIFSPKYKL